MKPEDVEMMLERCKTAGLRRSEEGSGQVVGTLPSLDVRQKTLRQLLSDDEKDFIQYLVEALPPVIARAEVDRFLPGLIKPQTLAQADSVGLGPEVAYRTDSLVLWQVGRCGISRLVTLNKFINLS